MGSHRLELTSFSQLHLCPAPSVGKSVPWAQRAVVLSSSPKFSSGRRTRLGVIDVSRAVAVGLEWLTCSPCRVFLPPPQGPRPAGGGLPFLFIFTGQSETALLLPEEGRGCVLLPAASAVGCADLSGCFPNLCSLCL